MNCRSIRFTVMSAVVMILASVLLLPASARVAHITSNHMSRVLQGQIDPMDLESFLDELFEQQMEELKIPGAAIVVVKDGDILLSKGYGFADLERQVPVDPAQTIMRAGSVSKLFAATAAMQLVEQGRLDLDTDVNQYLTSLQIPNNGYGPVTLRQLLTHTAGFEDRIIGHFTLDPDRYLPLAEHVAHSLPERDLEPGTVHSYSNSSFSLVGLIIEEVSGIPFEQYIDENILQPLEMESSSFEQPLPADLASDLAVGYFVEEGTYQPSADFTYELDGPAGALSTTATDMARFMIAHLQYGLFEETRILEEDTARQMQTQQFTHHPLLPGFAITYKERFLNGERLIGHGGDIGTYSAQLILHPEDNLGLYVAYNAFNDSLRERLIAAFMDRYYAESTPATTPDTIELTQDELARYTGNYRWVKHPRSTLGKIRALFPGPINVNITSTEDGTLSVTFFGAGLEWRYAPVAPLLFTQVQGGVQQLAGLEFDLGEKLVFRENDAGEVEFAFVALQNVALKKGAWYDAGAVQAGSLVLFLIMFVIPLIIWPLGALIRKLREKTVEVPTGARRARWVAALICILNLLFVAIILLTLGQLPFGVPLITRNALVIPILTTLLTVVMVWMTFQSWKERYWSVSGRLFYSFLTLTAILYVVWANYWNLLGWRF